MYTYRPIYTYLHVINNYFILCYSAWAHLVTSSTTSVLFYFTLYECTLLTAFEYF